MIINGRKIADEIKKELEEKIHSLGKTLSLTIFLSESNLAAKQFVNVKKRFAAEIGVEVVEEKILKSESIDSIVKRIRHSAGASDGIVIQLPLSANFNASEALNAIPKSSDVDVLSEPAIEDFRNEKLVILPPVAGAIKEIIDRHNVAVSGKKAVVIGKGKLVGEPSAIWFKNQGADVFVADSKTADLSARAKEADIIVSGVGIPNLITPDMIKGGVALFDAGTSEQKGKLIGDADPKCAPKCSVFTPVPGGIGPITVAVLFRNLIELNK